MTARVDTRSPADAGWTHEVHASIETIGPAWDDLARRLGAVPFARPGWVEPWWRAFGRGELVIVAVRRAGELRALFPAAREGAVLAGLANVHTPWFGPIADGADAAARLATSVAELAPGRIRIDQLHDDDPAARVFLGALRDRGWRRLDRTERSLVIGTTGAWDGYVGSISRSRASQVRRHLRQLERLGSVALDVAPRDPTPSHLDALLDAGFELEARGWKGAAGTAIASRPQTARFYREVAHWAAGEGILVLAEVCAGGRPVTWSLGIEAGGRHYALKLGVDPEFRRFGPGILHNYLLARRCFETDAEWFELLGWDEPWKRTLARDHRLRRHVVLYPPGLRGDAQWAAAATRRAAWRAAAAGYRRVRTLRGQA